MDQIKLGRTEMVVSRVGFGALPIQRVDFDTAKRIFLKAYDAGVNFFDTARAYTDSEEKIGYSLKDVRKNIYLATKSMGKTKKAVLADLEISLRDMQTDYVDLFQLHNPKPLPDFDDPEGAYAGALEAKRKGLCRYIGITNHAVGIAEEALKSDRFDTIQFPFNCLSTEREIELVLNAQKNDVGFIAMKALSGGAIRNISANFSYIRSFENVLPIYGIQRESELDEFLALEENPPKIDWDALKAERTELSGDFCRGCAYCAPCPQGILINDAARMEKMLKRSSVKVFTSDYWRAEMKKIENCTECGTCMTRCPYGLNIPNLLKANYTFYEEFIKQI